MNALAASPWGVVTIGLTIPIALLMGIHLRWIRPGRVLEASAIGLVLLVAALFAGRWAAEHPSIAAHVTLSRQSLAIWIMVYGFAASVLPVWLLLAPRDYLSAFVKIGVVLALAIGIVVVLPPLQMPALTRFAARGWADLRWDDLSLRLHHHRMRRDLWLPRAHRFRNDAEAART